MCFLNANIEIPNTMPIPRALKLIANLIKSQIAIKNELKESTLLNATLKAYGIVDILFSIPSTLSIYWCNKETLKTEYTAAKINPIEAALNP